SVRSTVRSSDPPAGPESTCVPLHGSGWSRNAIRRESQYQDRHVVPRLLLAERHHGFLDPPRDGVRLEAGAVLEERDEMGLAEQDVAGVLVGHAVGVEDQGVAGA